MLTTPAEAMLGKYLGFYRCTTDTQSGQGQKIMIEV